MTIARLFAFLFLMQSAVVFAAFSPANRPYNVTHYKLKMEIDPSKNPDKFSAQVEIKLKSKTPIETLSLDIDELTIGSVEMTKPVKKTLEFQTKTGKLLDITLPGKIKPGQEWSFTIVYQGVIHSSHNGLFRVTDPDEPDRGALVFSHLEPLGARSVFPCNDEPYAKATSEMEVTTPARFSVVSNGKLVSDKKLKRGKDAWHVVHWQLDKPQATYLTALAVGDFAKVATTHKSKEISFYVGKTKTEKAKYLLDVTKQSMEYFETYLGVPYPWNKYSVVGIPTFLWGGMENTTTTFQNQERSVLNDSKSAFEKKRITALSSHELAHQWFGDDVTLAWWDDVWLNESFASYMDMLAEKQIFKGDQAEIDLVTDTWDNYFRQEDGPRSHPIVDKELSGADDAFDSINYTKGENVLRMLSYYLGEDKFRKGVQAYLTAHAYGNATNKDLFESMEKAAAEDLTQFRDTWVLQRGYPVVTYGGTWDSDTNTYHLKISQRPNHPEDKTAFRFRIPVVYQRRAAPSFSKMVNVDMGKGDVTAQEIITNLPARPEWITVNPGAVVLARVQQADRDDAVLAAQALGDNDAIARIWAGYELARGLVDGDSISSFSEKTLVEMLRSDASPYVRIALLSNFQKMKSRWLPSHLSDAVSELARTSVQKGSEVTPTYLSDEMGWSQWRSELLGTMGRIDRRETLPFLAEQLAKKDLPLDDLSKTAISVAQLGDDKSAAVLREAEKLHKDRGYRYQYVVQYAFGAYESPKAAAEIRELTKTCASDLIGRWTGLLKNNHTLIHSAEWADFLRDFVLHNTRFGDEVKARLLETIEEVKSAEVKAAMEAIAKETPSDRMKEVARKVLDKNFPSKPS